MTEGFERGVEEAREILTAFARLDEDRSADVDQIVSLVYEGLDEFFAEETERYQSVTPAAS